MDAVKLLLPEIIVSLCGLIILTERIFTKADLQRKDAAWFGVGGLLLAGIFAAKLFGVNQTAFYGSYRVDDLAVFFKLVAIVAAGMTLLFAPDFLVRKGVKSGDFASVVLFAAAGMMLLPSALDFITLYIALELISVSFYVLLALQRGEVRPAEAGLKYLLLSGLASAVLLYGMSLIYGLTGSTYLTAIRQAFSAGEWPVLSGVGCLLILAGLGFKIYVVPFHMWAPDVYEGGPSPAVAFLATGSSAASLAAVLRLFGETFAGLSGVWLPLLVILALITVAIGNILALPQTNIKRLLAYSSIAHAGYILLAVVARSGLGTAAVMYYSLLYAVSTVTAFAVISAFADFTAGGETSAFAGLNRRAPFLTFVMVIALASLAGVPPLAGFMAKFAVFAAAVQAGYVVIAAVALLLSVISIYYYFQVIKVMYVDEPAETTPITYGWGTQAALILGLAGVILLGLFPGPLLRLAQVAAGFTRF